ncbi:MAG TPA: hypothetical protein VNV62_29465 [Trebonia sp.]|nr:hypothetical protein [Trebonia sp.]
MLAFAADAGASAALGGQHAGVAGVGITPAQAGLQLAGQRGVIAVVRAAHDKGAYRTESDPWRSLFDWSAAARVLGWQPRYQWSTRGHDQVG